MNCDQTLIPDNNRCRFRPVSGGGLRVVMRLTMRCDLACPHCLAMKTKEYTELSTEQWLTLINQFTDIGVKKALLTGGEPLLRHDIIAIVEALSNAGIQTDLNSNLQCMNPELMRKLKKACLSEISTSLEGTEEIHNRMHGSDVAYSNLIKAVAWANRNYIPVDSSCCLTTENYHFIPELIRNAKTLSIRSLTFSRLLPVGHGYNNRSSLTQEQLDACYHVIENEIAAGQSIPIRITGLLGAPEQKDCGRGSSLVSITPDGYLLGCVLTDDNPSVSHPLDIGLRRAYDNLQKELTKRQYSLCWQENMIYE